MARFAVLAIFATAFAGALAEDAVDYGLDMAGRAFDAVCFYENLGSFPETDSKRFGKCGSTAALAKKSVDEPAPGNVAFLKASPDNKAKLYGMTLGGGMSNGMPNEYNSKCGKYLEDISASYDADESDALNDPNSGMDYPLKAYANCMMHTLRTRKTDKAIEKVKKELTHSRKHWQSALLDRENEFRARHGVQPLKLVKDLSTAAQQWADRMAKNCKMEHSKNEDPGRQWRGSGTGESLSTGGGADDKFLAAYQAADGWYEEVKDYPYPGGYKGDGHDALFEKIGHFTQSVWKQTEYVGFGYAYNPSCNPFKRYVAARYSPAGNMRGAYVDNVNPIQG